MVIGGARHSFHILFLCCGGDGGGGRAHRRATHINELENEIRKPSNYLLLIIINHSTVSMAWFACDCHESFTPWHLLHRTILIDDTAEKKTETLRVNYAN